MLSRVAERVFWMARYAERAENIARIINVYTNLLLDLPRNYAIGWHSLVEITGSKELYHEFNQEDNERHIMRFMLSDTRNPGSLLNSLNYARENARTIRDLLPREGWEKINELYLTSKKELPTVMSRRNRYEFLSFLIGNIQQLTGLLAGTMPYNSGYHFVCIGRNLERADMTSRIADTMTVQTVLNEQKDTTRPYDYVLWMNVLKSLSAYQSYRQEVRAAVSRDNIVNFIVKNREFPRAILHCLYEIQNATQKLPRHIIPLRHLNRLLKKLEDTEVAPLDSNELHQFIDTIQMDIASFNRHFSETYFAVQEISTKRREAKADKTIETHKIRQKSADQYELRP